MTAGVTTMKNNTIVIQSPRAFADFMSRSVFTYITLLKSTNLRKVDHLQRTSAEYLSVLLINSLLDDADMIIRKKLINTTAPFMKIKFTHAQGIALYKVLLTLPIPDQEFYFNTVVCKWIELLDKEIIKAPAAV